MLAFALDVGATSAQCQAVRGRVTMADGSVVAGALSIKGATFRANQGRIDDDSTSDAFTFMADGSDAAVNVRLRDLKWIALVYDRDPRDQDSDAYTIRRTATLELHDGRVVHGTIPNTYHYGHFTCAILVETGPLVIQRFDLPDFVSSYFPPLSPDRTVARVDIGDPPRARARRRPVS